MRERGLSGQTVLGGRLRLWRLPCRGHHEVQGGSGVLPSRRAQQPNQDLRCQSVWWPGEKVHLQLQMSGRSASLGFLSVWLDPYLLPHWMFIFFTLFLAWDGVELLLMYLRVIEWRNVTRGIVNVFDLRGCDRIANQSKKPLSLSFNTRTRLRDYSYSCPCFNIFLWMVTLMVRK